MYEHSSSVTPVPFPGVAVDAFDLDPEDDYLASVALEEVRDSMPRHLPSRVERKAVETMLAGEVEYDPNWDHDDFGEPYVENVSVTFHVDAHTAVVDAFLHYSPVPPPDPICRRRTLGRRRERRSSTRRRTRATARAPGRRDDDPEPDDVAVTTRSRR